MAKLLEKDNYYRIIMESNVEDITITISDYVSDLNGLNVIYDETGMYAIRQDLKHIIDNVENIIEKEVDKIEELYLSSSNEDRVKIISDLSYLIEDDNNIKYYIDLFMNRNNLQYIDNKF